MKSRVDQDKQEWQGWLCKGRMEEIAHFWGSRGCKTPVQHMMEGGGVERK